MHDLACKVLLFLTGVTFVGMLVLVYFAFIDGVNPLISNRFLASIIYDGGQQIPVSFAREVCFNKDNEALVLRVFERIDPNGYGVSEIFEAQPMLAHYNIGCNVRMIRAEIPKELDPGQYIYRLGMRWCNGMARCNTEWLQEIEVTILGECEQRRIIAQKKDDRVQ